MSIKIMKPVVISTDVTQYQIPAINDNDHAMCSIHTKLNMDIKQNELSAAMLDLKLFANLVLRIDNVL